MSTSPMLLGRQPRLLYRLGPVVFLMLLSAPGPALWALNTETTRTTLRGLTGIEVAVSPVPATLEDAGVTRQLVQSEVEQQLRGAGIAVVLLTRQEAAARQDVAFFAVAISSLSHELGVYAYSVDLAVYQSATLLRDATPISVPTWTTGSLGLVGESRLNTILKTVHASVDHFIQAYRAVNPRASKAAASSPTPTARLRQVQERLHAAGFSPGAADGQLGPHTRQALRRYQQTKGLEVTGQPDAKTLQALGLQ